MSPEEIASATHTLQQFAKAATELESVASTFRETRSELRAEVALLRESIQSIIGEDTQVELPCALGGDPLYLRPTTYRTKRTLTANLVESCIQRCAPQIEIALREGRHWRETVRNIIVDQVRQSCTKAYTYIDISKHAMRRGNSTHTRRVHPDEPLARLASELHAKKDSLQILNKRQKRELASPKRRHTSLQPLAQQYMQRANSAQVKLGDTVIRAKARKRSNKHALKITTLTSVLDTALGHVTADSPPPINELKKLIMVEVGRFHDDAKEQTTALSVTCTAPR